MNPFVKRRRANNGATATERRGADCGRTGICFHCPCLTLNASPMWLDVGCDGASKLKLPSASGAWNRDRINYTASENYNDFLRVHGPVVRELRLPRNVGEIYYTIIHDLRSSASQVQPSHHDTMPRTPEAQAFFHAVYSAVQEIPPGKVTSYGHIAKLVGTRTHSTFPVPSLPSPTRRSSNSHL